MKKKIDGRNNKKAYESRTKAKTVGQKGQFTGQKKKSAVKTIANDFGYNTRKITVRLKRLQNIGIKCSFHVHRREKEKKERKIAINVV